MKITNEKSGASIVVKALEQHGVKFVFGIPGAKIDKVFELLRDSTIQTVVCRHEQNAAFIAGGFGRLTGKAGVVIATSGPGVSNLVTGLATANTEGDPVLALGGAVPTSQGLKQMHQALHSVAVLKPVTKFSAEVDSSESIAEVMANALRAAESDRPGAAFISLPKDIMENAAKCEVLPLPPSPTYGLASESSIDEAVRILKGSSRAVVLLGLLASKPKNAEAIRTFIRKTRMPVVGTFQAAGAISADLFQSFAGRVGQLDNQPGDELLRSADVVITIGFDPVEYDPSIWNRHKKATILHIDSTKADIDNFYNPAIELLGDVATTLIALSAKLDTVALAPDVEQFFSSLVTQRQKVIQEARSRTGSLVHPLRIVSELQNILEEDITLCCDMGSFHLWIARYLFSFRARQIMISNGQQTLGVALPWAIAASLLRPHEKTLSISGDGGFLFSSMELETAVRFKLNIVHLIWIDGTYDMVAVQEQAKYGRTAGIQFGPVDVVKYAEAFGATGLMIKSPDEVGSTLRRAFDIDGPVLVGVHVDYSDNHLLFDEATKALLN